MFSIIVALFIWPASAGGASGLAVDDGDETFPISNSFSLDVEGDSESYLRSCTTQFPSEFGIAATDGYQYDDKLYFITHTFNGAGRTDISATRQSRSPHLDMSTLSSNGERDYTGFLTLILGIFGLALVIAKKEAL